MISDQLVLDEKDFLKEHGVQYRQMLEEAENYVAHPEMLVRDIELKKAAVAAKTGDASFPVPKPDEFHFRMTRYKGFLYQPKRLMNYVLSLKERRGTTQRALPSIMDVEPTSRCNFRCIMCQVSEWEGGKRAEDLQFDDFKKLIDSQYGLMEVKLQGMGEPLFNKDFFRMAEYLAERHIWIRTTVNGSMLNVNNNYKKLVDTGFGEVQLSFDGATKEVFEDIRKNSNFDKVVSNITALNEYANSKNVLLTRMWVLMQEKNRHQLYDFAELAQRMKFKRLTYSLGMSDFGQKKWNSTNKTLQIKRLLSGEELERLQQESKKSGLDITFWDLTAKYTNDTPESKCGWPFSRAFVSSDMKIVPCCMIANPDVSNLGDARNFTEEWNSPKYQGFRQAHLKGTIPSYCQNCYKHDAEPSALESEPTLQTNEHV